MSKSSHDRPFISLLLKIAGGILCLVAALLVHAAFKFGNDMYLAAAGASVLSSLYFFATATVIRLLAETAESSKTSTADIFAHLQLSRKSADELGIQLAAINDTLRKANHGRVETNKALQWILDNWQQQVPQEP